jgi:hypothetical protein
LQKKVLPNFFIVGAAKAGTTSFAEYLGQHPQVYMSPVKEPNYFSSDIESRHIRERIQPEEYFAVQPLRKRHALCVRQPEHYEQLFAAAGDAKAIGEASVSYIYSEFAPRRIAAEIADPRILVFLRNPVERAYSHFQMDLVFGVANTDDFLEAVEVDRHSPRKGWGVSHLYVELGLYVPQLKRWLAAFPADRVKICLHDDYKKDVGPTLLAIFSFLGVEQTLADISFDVKHGEAGRNSTIKGLDTLSETRPYRILRGAVPPVMRAGVKRLLSRKPRKLRVSEFEALIPYFREDIRELSSLLGRDLSHWLVPSPAMLRA